jgi:hypothetical protein
MSASLKTRKPVYKLMVGDLVAFPIWEFATDEEGVEGQDETWVRPVKRKKVPAGACSHLVATVFRTAGGQVFHGFMMVNTVGNTAIRAGAVLAKNFYLVLPDMSEDRAWKKGLDFAIRFREDLLKALRRTEAKVFPISYTLHVRIRGENALRSGVLE